MSENKDGWPDRFHVLPSPVRAVGRGVIWLFSLHLLSSHSDHFNKGGGPALDRELYDQQEERMKAYWASLCPDKVEPPESVIHTSLVTAVESGVMSPDEANECEIAYLKAFHGEVPDDAA